jgi:hypothetical protein
MRGWKWMYAAAFLVLGTAGSVSAGEADNAPVYLIISVTPEFDTVGEGSQTILANVGTFVAGPDIGSTEFVAAVVPTIPLPPGVGPFDLNANEATILGSFRATDLAEIHLASPTPIEIPPEIQAAVFLASRDPVGGDFFGIEDLIMSEEGAPVFPSTRDIAEVIAEFLPDGGAELGVDDVLEHVFATDVTLSGDSLSVGAEGEMFPHEPGDPLFVFTFSLDEEGAFDSDICEPVGVDVEPSNTSNAVNFADNGTLWVAFITDGAFDALDVDPSTIEIGGVSPVQVLEKDVDDDGDKDLKVKFDVGDLIDGGALTASTDELFMVAELDDGSCVAGHDTVNVNVSGNGGGNGGGGGGGGMNGG